MWQGSRLYGHFSLDWNPALKLACLKLQVKINLAQTPNLPNQMSLFLLISPDGIHQISAGPSNDLFGAETRTLDSVLSRPPFLVVPSQSWEARDDVSKITRDLLYDLAKQTRFTLCTKISGQEMSIDEIHDFCAAAPGCTLSADVKRFCRGDGRIVEGESLLSVAPAPTHGETPPILDSAPRYSESPELLGRYSLPTNASSLFTL